MPVKTCTCKNDCPTCNPDAYGPSKTSRLHKEI